jgi:hypothetical protein
MLYNVKKMVRSVQALVFLIKPKTLQDKILRTSQIPQMLIQREQLLKRTAQLTERILTQTLLHFPTPSTSTSPTTSERLW